MEVSRSGQSSSSRTVASPSDLFNLGFPLTFKNRHPFETTADITFVCKGFDHQLLYSKKEDLGSLRFLIGLCFEATVQLFAMGSFGLKSDRSRQLPKFQPFENSVVQTLVYYYVFELLV